MDRERLAKLLGMLDSAHDGEVLNAAKLAVRIVKDAGITWEQAITPRLAESPAAYMSRVAAEAAKGLLAENDQLREINRQLGEELAQLRARRLQTPMSWNPPRGAAAAIEQAIEWTVVLSDWEREFITSIAGRRVLSERQRDRLLQITQKIERFARARNLASSARMRPEDAA